MAESVPLNEMLFAVTVREVPTAAVSKFAVPLTVNESPIIRSSLYVTDAAVRPLYTLFDAVMVTARGFAVIFAVVVAEVLAV